jgi:hypothetical protein
MGAVGNYEVVDQVEELTGSATPFTVPAPEGKKVFSGSMLPPETGSYQLHRSYPNEDGTEWNFVASGSPTDDVTFRVVCAEMC